MVSWDFVLKEYVKNERRNKNFKDLIHSLDLARIARLAKFSYRKVFNRTQKFIKDFVPFMKPYYHIVWSVEKYTKSKNPKNSRIKNGRIMLLSKFAMRDSKESKFIKQQEAKGLLSSLVTKTHLIKIPLVGRVFF